jgi:hypothetical protein
MPGPVWLAQFPLAANSAAKFFRIARCRDDSRGIGPVASKACGKFPVRSGQGIRQAAAGKFSQLVGNSQGRAENRRQRHDPMLAGHLLSLKVGDGCRRPFRQEVGPERTIPPGANSARTHNGGEDCLLPALAKHGRCDA